MDAVRRTVGWPFKAAAVLVWIVFGLWAFALELGIVAEVAGFWGLVVAFVVAPVTFAAAPWYAGVAWGNWTPLIIGYGGTLGGGLLFGLGSMIAGND